MVISKDISLTSARGEYNYFGSDKYKMYKYLLQTISQYLQEPYTTLYVLYVYVTIPHSYIVHHMQPFHASIRAIRQFLFIIKYLCAIMIIGMQWYQAIMVFTIPHRQQVFFGLMCYLFEGHMNIPLNTRSTAILFFSTLIFNTCMLILPLISTQLYICMNIS